MKTDLLLHACCAPCSSGVVPQLNKYNITLLFYNPNIDTIEEYNRRLEAMNLFVSQYNTEFGTNITCIAIPYEHNAFLQVAQIHAKEKEGGLRCSACIAERLEFTAKYAKEQGYPLFASTLSVSPHKNNELINKIGNSLQDKYNIEYLPSNFKKNNGFLNSINNSKKYKLYRQAYCGCEFAKGHLQDK